MPSSDLSQFRRDLAAWLDHHRAELVLTDRPGGLDGDVAQMRHAIARLHDAGWMRYGWPEAVGGLGGPDLLRVAFAEEVAARDLFSAPVYTLTEILGPPVTELAPDIAREFVPRLLRGEETWCQGFSEPDAGSDLASLRTKAVEDGDCFRVTGQKIWSSFAQYASRMVLLARTGTAESRHRGITAFFIDLDTPGITVRPFEAIHGQPDFNEVFFDDACIPKNRVIGTVDGGWPVTMRILQAERGAIFWMESAWMLARLREFVAGGHLGADADEALGHAYASIAAIRSRSWTTQHRIAEGTIASPETSIDKILTARAEQELFDLLQTRGGGLVEFGDDDLANHWRSEYMYSRAASIYGGTSEIQKNILADHVLGMRGAS